MGALGNAAPHSSSAFFCRLRKQLSCRSPKCALPLAKLSLLSPSEIQGCIRETNKSRVVLWHLAIRQHYKPLLAYLLKKVNYLYSYHAPVQVPLFWILSKPQTKTLQLVVSRVQHVTRLIYDLRILDHTSALQSWVTSSVTCHMYALQILHCLHSHHHQVMCPTRQEMFATTLNRNFCLRSIFKVIKCLIRKRDLLLCVRYIHFTSGNLVLFDRASILLVPENSVVYAILQRWPVFQRKCVLGNEE